MIDPILRDLTIGQVEVVEAELSNSENSTDDELREHFIRELGLSEEQARRALTYRSAYAQNIFMVGYTPILKGEEAYRYDPVNGGFERWNRE